MIHEGNFNYSSLSAGRPATKSEGWIYLHFEGGLIDGPRIPTVARFNLSWLLKGEKTGDVELPKWLPDTTIISDREGRCGKAVEGRLRTQLFFWLAKPRLEIAGVGSQIANKFGQTVY